MVRAKSPGEVGEIVPGTPLDVERFFKLDVLEPETPGYLEPLILEGEQDGQLWLVYSEPPKDQLVRFRERKILGSGWEEEWGPRVIRFIESRDGGRTWREEWTALDSAGRDFPGFHTSVLRLKSGRLGMIYTEANREYGHPGRDSCGLVHYRVSEDRGRTWSDPVLLDRMHACCCTGHAVVLSSGRIVAPSTRWISPLPGGEAESWEVNAEGVPSPTFSYSFTYISDDEGETWKRSLSELFVSVNRAAWDLEEPTVVELRDGRLLMHLRAAQGRMYKSFSPDGGSSWTRPEAVHIAAANAPSMIRRMPSTGELLMVWNQASRQEIVTSNCRIRLSCAISKDEGETWENFKNLESLDDVTSVTPPPARESAACVAYEVYSNLQPRPAERYHRAPGPLRICYPTIAFAGEEAAIAYDLGRGTCDGMGARLRVIPLEWFRE